MLAQRMGRDVTVSTWPMLRDDFRRVNLELSNIIDTIDPNNSYKLIKVNYLYGDVFINHGKVQLPSGDKLGSLEVIQDAKVQAQLSYSSLPLFLILNKNSELFFNTGERVIPLDLISKGMLVGTYEMMDYMLECQSNNAIYNFAAGSRSIFMLPKITDKVGLKRLHKAYDLPVTIHIKHLSDHWELFRIIAQNEHFQQYWSNSIVYFGKEWLESIKKSPGKGWVDLRNYLLKMLWRQANYAIGEINFNICWEYFSHLISARRLHPKPYLIDQVKHLLAIITGHFPGFTVVNDGDESAPSEALQKVFVEHYELKQYLPTMMHARRCIAKRVEFPYFYYSLCLPTVLEGSPLKRNTTTIINDLREIKLLVDTLQSRSQNLYNIALQNMIQKNHINFFHYKYDMYNQIRGSEDIVLEDPTFLQDQTLFSDRKFCATSPFFSGCIRINNQGHSDSAHRESTERSGER